RVEQIRNGHKVTVYYPDAGQTQYEKNRKNSKKKFKVLECVDFIKFVEESFKDTWLCGFAGLMMLKSGTLAKSVLNAH
ncbi:hypothetical protein HMPREF3183_01353, partial [Peptostreptococcus anaerobius]